MQSKDIVVELAQPEIITDIKIKEHPFMVVFITTRNIYEIMISSDMVDVCGSPALMVCENNRCKFAMVTNWYGGSITLNPKTGEFDHGASIALKDVLAPYIGQQVVRAGLYVDNFYFHNYHCGSTFIDGLNPTVEIKTDKSMINFMCAKFLCDHCSNSREESYNKLNVRLRFTKITPTAVKTYEESINNDINYNSEDSD